MTDLLTTIKKHWGFSSFRPLQAEACQAVLDRRDSLVIMPTGGGKSMCFQAPAACSDGLTVVVSPLLALMKDQVDALTARGIPAARLDSTMTKEDVACVMPGLLRNEIRLLYVSPERLAGDLREFLAPLNVTAVAIDEVHAISHFGHDFRPEYRKLGTLREIFPEASVHGYTATATEVVRRDICDSLRLRDAVVLVGDFHRPNLRYRVQERTDTLDDVTSILKAHSGQAGIVYCIRRADVDKLCEQLTAVGFAPMPYHAGLTTEERQAAQEAFITKKCNLIVATIAFGMGIDRGDVRFVIHTGLPKSIEHYQQEAGRAGRDGQPADCILLYGKGDAWIWKFIFEKGAEERMQTAASHEAMASAYRHLDQMADYCTRRTCRHKTLVEHFGQPFVAHNCGACDICCPQTRSPESGDRKGPSLLRSAFDVWRQGEALKRGLAAWAIVSDFSLDGIARDKPQTVDALAAYGMPSKRVDEYGRQIIKIVKGTP